MGPAMVLRRDVQIHAPIILPHKLLPHCVQILAVTFRLLRIPHAAPLNTTVLVQAKFAVEDVQSLFQIAMVSTMVP